MAADKNFVGLKSSKLNINDIIETVVSSNCGAVSTFIGTTRDNFEQKKVVKLEYEAYEPMAIKSMQTLCTDIRLKWDVEKIAIYHRLGEVPVKEASIVIAISSPHRQESLQAVQFAIDSVKTSVPIWKKEVYENDEPQWKENKECSWAANDKEKIDGAKEDACSYESNSNVIVDDIEIDFNNVCETIEVSADCANNTEACQDVENYIDPDQIQVKADADELNRRIESFILRKREQVNLVNVQGFCTHSGPNQEDDEDDETCVCARVNAAYIRRSDSKGHVKVHRVYNQWSQQNIKSSLPIKQENETNDYPPALEERLSATEKILGINKPVPKDVYDRIKKIEDRLLFLESISPEYKEIWANDDCDSVKSFDGNFDTKPARKRTYSSAELDSKVNELEERYTKRIK